MQQLSEQDAAFLASDNAHANANVSLLHIYDQRTAPAGKVRFKTLLAHIESRLGAAPVFRRKLMQLPLGVDRPYWVDDENFDFEYHVRHIALPKPGDWRQFCIQVSRIHARRLDLNRPLWEIYVIEGLDSFLDLPKGSFALLTKTHHAALDFQHDHALMALLHDLSPARAAPPPPAPWFAESAPAVLPLLARGVLRNLVAPRRLAGPLSRRLLKLAPSRLALAGDLLLGGAQMPLVRFNAVVSPHRVFETRRFALDEFERIRRLVKGATLHDAVLAVCGGALRQYLEGHDELPAQTLFALAPPPSDAAVTEGEASSPSALRVALGTELQNPVQRLRLIRAQTSGRSAVGSPDPQRRGAAALLGRTAQRVGSALARSLAEAVAGSLAGSRGSSRAHERTGHALSAACSITHLPAPPGPQYLCGARLSYCSAMLPISDGLGLAFAVTGCEGRIIISPTSCRELMPDPERFAQCLRESFQALLALTPQLEVASAAAKPARATKPRQVASVPAQNQTKPPAS